MTIKWVWFINILTISSTIITCTNNTYERSGSVIQIHVNSLHLYLSVHVRVPNSVYDYQLRDRVQSVGPSFVHAACQLGIRYGHCYTKRRVVSLYERDHQGSTTRGVWTGPECLLDRTLAWLTQRSIDALHHWFIEQGTGLSQQFIVRDIVYGSNRTTDIIRNRTSLR